MNEKQAVAMLGEQIGFGRMMQLAEQIWGEMSAARGIPGSQHTTGPCASQMVPCPHLTDENEAWRDANGHCDWCCGAGRVTKRVAKAMGA